MINRIFLIVLSTVVLFGCTDNQQEESTQKGIKTISIDPTKNETVLASELFSETRFIKLETSDSSLIDEVVKVIHSSNRYYIRAGTSLLVFDEKGKFIFKINRKGKGPEQYMGLTDILIDSTKNQIEILDGNGRKIMYFDTNGQYQNYWKHDILSIAFTRLDEQNYAFYCGNMGNGDLNKQIIIKAKNADKVSASFLDINTNQAKYMHFMDMVNFGKASQGNIFSHSSENVVYQINPNDLSSKYTIDFGKYEMPQELLDKPYENVAVFMQEVTKKDIAFLVDNFYDFDKSIFFTFRFAEKALRVYYSKQDDIYKVINKIKDDINFPDFNISYENFPVGGLNNELFFSIESEVFISQVKQIKKKLSKKDWEAYSKKHPEIIEIFNTTKPGDNPILMLAKLK